MCINKNWENTHTSNCCVSLIQGHKQCAYELGKLEKMEQCKREGIEYVDDEEEFEDDDDDEVYMCVCVCMYVCVCVYIYIYYMCMYDVCIFMLGVRTRRDWICTWRGGVWGRRTMYMCDTCTHDVFDIYVYIYLLCMYILGM